MHKPGIRGIRGFEQFTRFTLDVAAIPVIQRLSHLPILADPSHSTGKWYLVTPVALSEPRYSPAFTADSRILSR